MGEDILAMSQKEIKRLHVIQKVVEKSLKQVEAAKILSLSDRQIRRIKGRVAAQGAAGIKHGSCGKRSRNATDEKIIITKNGRPAAVLVSPEEFESLKETIAIRSDLALMREIKKGLRALRNKKAKLYTLEELFR